jgi:hypothetical protein
MKHSHRDLTEMMAQQEVTAAHTPLLLCDMSRSEVAERHRGAERHARRRILATHDRIHVIATSVQAIQGPARTIEKLRILIGHKAQTQPRSLTARAACATPAPS